MDSKASVTYKIRSGDTGKFIIDAKTGTVRTRQSLDYEQQTQHILTIGTLENTNLSDPQATTTLIINVQVYIHFRRKKPKLLISIDSS